MKNQFFYIVLAGLLTALTFDLSCSKSLTCPSCPNPVTSAAVSTRTIPLKVDQWNDQGNGKFESDLKGQIRRSDSSFTVILKVVYSFQGMRGTLTVGNSIPFLGGELLWDSDALVFYSSTDKLPFMSIGIEVTVY